MKNDSVPVASLTREIFWVAWPILTCLALAVVLLTAIDMYGYEGQPTGLVEPTKGLMVAGQDRLGQSFVAPRDGLERVDVLLYGFDRVNTQPVTFHLRQLGTEQDIVVLTFDAGQVPGRRWMPFEFSAIPDSAGHSYEFFFESPTSTETDGLTMIGVQGDLYPNGDALFNSFPVAGDATFKTHYANVSAADKLAALAGKITLNRPFVWGDARFYTLLALLYLLLMVGLGWLIIKARPGAR